MIPLRPTLQPVSFANKYMEYIVVLILTAYAKADLGKEIKRISKASAVFCLVAALKRRDCFSLAIKFL